MQKSHLDPERYEPDEDGFPREIVGPWVREKHARLERYVGISSAVRKKFIGPGNAGATFIDLFCGPGRARIKDETQVIHGSPIAAWEEAIKWKSAFTQIHIADAEEFLLEAAETRLRRIDAPVQSELGLASETVSRIIRKLSQYGLHFAFLDPYKLGALPFGIIRKLATIERMDILVHISGQDLQRNLDRYIAQEDSPLDKFAPGWRTYVDAKRPQPVVRAEILKHWRRLLSAEGMTTAETFEKVKGSNNQPLYWLAFAARHPLALEFWDKIRDVSPGGQLSLL